MNARQRLLRLFAPALACLVAGAAFGAPGVLEPQMLSDETYTESFVAFADLSDGTYVKVQLGISNVGPGDGKGACRLMIVRPSGKPWSGGDVIDRDKWRYDGGAEPKLTFDRCVMTAGDKLVIKAPVAGATLELTLDGKAASTRAPVHEVKAGKDFYELEVLIPWAKATVTLTLPGQKPVTLSGFGYADHSRSTALPGKLADQWVRFRTFGAGTSELFMIRLPPGSRTPTGWHWAEAGGGRKDVSRLSVRRRGEKGDTHFQVMVDGDGGPWRLTSEKLLDRDAPIEDQGVFGSLVGAVVGNPVTYTYRGVLEDKASRSKREGILEVTITDE